VLLCCLYVGIGLYNRRTKTTDCTFYINCNGNQKSIKFHSFSLFIIYLFAVLVKDFNEEL